MPDLSEVILKLRQQNPGGNIAGYMEGTKFIYEASSSDNLPAAAFLFDGSATRIKAHVYTTLPISHWLYTYMGAKDKNGGLVHVSGNLKVNINVTESARAGKRTIKVVGGQAPAGPLGSGGGLFEATKTLASYKGKKGEKVPKVHTEEKGLHRALRYYMLAAYAVLGKCAKANYEGGNYVCALAVNDSGQIFSWGVNSGSFHHGEVNMLMNYFSNNPTEKALPANTIVFSTLTPCQQCSGFLQSVNPGRIFMGQKDTGPVGQAGEAFGSFLGKLTDPIMARVSSGEGLTRRDGTVTTYDLTVATKKNKLGAVTVPKFVTDPAPKGTRFELDTVLEQLVTDGNIASKIGQYCRRELRHSYDTLDQKYWKTRPLDILDGKVKMAVLTYLHQWMKTVDATVSEKTIA